MRRELVRGVSDRRTTCSAVVRRRYAAIASTEATTRIPTLQARAIHISVPTGLPVNRSRAASRIEVTGWFSATSRTARACPPVHAHEGRLVAGGNDPGARQVGTAAGRQRQRWYHTWVDKTTIYLPAALKAAVRRAARRRGISEAQVIRESIASAVADERPRPRGALFHSGAPIARDVDAHLAGFGER